jgi:hypothetical protein
MPSQNRSAGRLARGMPLCRFILISSTTVLKKSMVKVTALTLICDALSQGYCLNPDYLEPCGISRRYSP